MTGTIRLRKPRLALPHWATTDHPVFDLEMRRRLDNRALAGLRLGCVPALFGVTSLALILILGTVALPQLSFGYQDWHYLIPIILSWMLGVLAVIQVGAGAMANVLTLAQTAPVVSSEVELQSWRLLRTTTLTLREILYAKIAAALAHQRAPLFGLMILRFITAGTGLLVYVYVLRDTIAYMDANQIERFLLGGEWVPAALVVWMGMVFLVSQPLLQGVLNAALGMLASVYSASRGQSIAAALVGRLVLWVGSILANIGAIFALGFMFSQWTSPYSAIFEAYRARSSPGEMETAWAASIIVVGYLVSTLAIQGALILIALGVMQRRARNLGV